MGFSDLLGAFLSSARAWHHNVLSWYIRPLFLLPLCYFTRRRSCSGVVQILAALAIGVAVTRRRRTRRAA